ncbi:hypothetical protein E2C01_009896 [Portunus trituberculatus]|uniref:Uncharacterized protein n=1 Tax=Portunus trituberculatus TaxID=210409 RepID=A0A5B7D6X6_PORTR|nr:hypothetical protein [Portunus trituberculatus]
MVIASQSHYVLCQSLLTVLSSMSALAQHTWSFPGAAGRGASQQRLSSSLLLYKKVGGAGGGAAVNALLKDRPPAAAASQPGPSSERSSNLPAPPSLSEALTQQATQSLSLAQSSSSSSLQLAT